MTTSDMRDWWADGEEAEHLLLHSQGVAHRGTCFLLLLIKRVWRLLRILECNVVPCLCAHQVYEYPVGSSVWFCSSWEDFGRNKSSGLEVRCTGMRTHHCHHTVEEGFHIHTAGKSPIVKIPLISGVLGLSRAGVQQNPLKISPFLMLCCTLLISRLHKWNACQISESHDKIPVTWSDVEHTPNVTFFLSNGFLLFLWNL